MIGQTIAHYRVTGKLGEGGMGAVYRAQDSKLDRDVAIKVLPPTLARDADYLARFQREAQMLASLNHPNIAAIYGLEENAIVMELVEGETLADRIARGAIPLDDALPIARQVAEALEAAHERGIIHRDLKPANVKITPEGVVKVLDFGLAKSSEPASAAANAANSPTLTIRATQAGLILGTPGYMAPEQAAGKSVDKRADVWAFGVVLWEMLTGRPLFRGETVSHTLANVLKGDIDLAAVSPGSLRDLIGRCLERNPRSRLRDIGEARLAIERYADAPIARRERSSKAWLPWALAALATAALTVALVRRSTPSPDPIQARFVLSPPENTRLSAGGWPPATPSPDGRHIAFTTTAFGGSEETSGIWVRPTRSLLPRRLEKTGDATYLLWSPDGRTIAYFTLSGELKAVAKDGGLTRTIIAPQRALPHLPRGADWSPEGKIIFGLRDGPLQQVSAGEGGAPEVVTKLDEKREEIAHLWPQFLPGSRRFIYLARSRNPDHHAVYAQDAGSTNRTLILKSPTRAGYAAPGFLVFARDTTLVAQRFDPDALRLSGPEIPIAENVRTNPSLGEVSFAVSPSGTLIYGTGTPRGGGERQLTLYDRKGRGIGVFDQPRRFGLMALSPDQKRLAISLAGSNSTSHIWVMNLPEGRLTRLTFEPYQFQEGPVWSPDGRRLYFSDLNGGIMWEADVDTGATRPLSGSPSPCFPVSDVTPDGLALLCSAYFRGVILLPLANPLEAKPLETPARYRQPMRLSPDGTQLAYVSAESGRNELYVAGFPSLSGKRRISAEGAADPSWSPDGHELFFRSRDGTMMSARFPAGPSGASSAPGALFRVTPREQSSQYVVLENGQKFLILEPAGQRESERETHVVLNWWAEIGK